MSGLIDWLVEHEPAFRKSRLPSLYSDLSVQKTTNPEGYAANIATWQAALVCAAEAGQLPGEQRLTLQASEELLSALASPQYGRPSGLGLVLDEGVKERKMFALQDFRNAQQSIYHRTWLPSPVTVLRWSLRQAGLAGNTSYDTAGRLRSGQLVLIHALERVYKLITAARAKEGSNLTDRVMTREVFTNRLALLDDTILQPSDVDILLLYLARDQGLVSYDSKIVKFKSASSESPEPITSEDTTIANLKSLLASLESQITNLNIRISSLQRNAKSAVESKNKVAALAALRSKKLAEGALQQRTSTLTQLEEVYAKIEQAVDQVQIVQVMESSISVLQGLNKQTGGVERVEDVVDNLREEMSKVDEVGQVLQEPLDGRMVLDEAEIDDELAEMEKVERTKQEAEESEATRKRLAVLEEAQKRQQVEEKEKQQQQEQNDYKLRRSIEQLESMKLSDESSGQERDAPEKREQREAVAE